MAKTKYDASYLTALRQNLTEYFDEQELASLSFDLGIDYESLKGEGTAAKARELVAYCVRHGQVRQLTQAAARQRPTVEWENRPTVLELARAVQAAAICYQQSLDAVKFLLVRTSGGCWIFPKGDIKEGEPAWQTAQRKARQEAGVTGDISQEPLIVFRHLKGGRSKEELYVTAFLLKVVTTLEPTQQRRQPTWLTPEEAEEALAADRDPGHANELVRVLYAARGRLAV